MISKTFFKEIQTSFTQHQNLIVGYSSAKVDFQWSYNDHTKRDFSQIPKMLDQLWEQGKPTSHPKVDNPMQGQEQYCCRPSKQEFSTLL